MWKSEFKAEVQTRVVFLSFPALRNVLEGDLFFSPAKLSILAPDIKVNCGFSTDVNRSSRSCCASSAATVGEALMDLLLPSPLKKWSGRREYGNEYSVTGRI